MNAPSLSANDCAESHMSRDEMILSHLPQVLLVARKLHRRLPANVTLDDLVSAGTVGLITAVDRFDASRGWKLKTYAERRVLGAMLDLLRKEDTRSRIERRRAREMPGSGETPCGSPVSLDSLLAARPGMTVVDVRPSPLDQVLSRERNVALRAGLNGLTALERSVLRLCAGDGMTNRIVAIRLNTHESRVSEIKRKAILRLRSAMSKRAVAAA